MINVDVSESTKFITIHGVLRHPVLMHVAFCPANTKSGGLHRFRCGGYRLAGGLLALVLSACSTPPPAPPPAPVVARAPDYHRGMRVYHGFCASCHDGANVEAPPLDDIEAWDERAFEWESVLREHAARGFLTMPENSQLSEENINDALFYMETRIRAIDEQSHNTLPRRPDDPALPSSS